MAERNEIHQQHSGPGDNVARDKIVNIYGKAADYHELDKHLKKLQAQKANVQERIVKYPNDEGFASDLLTVNEELTEQEDKIDSFIRDVSRLYEIFNKIEINTERLRLAKAHFDKGEFREADAILKAEEISHEVTQLKQAKGKKEHELAEINEHLESKANEFLVKAQLWKTFYNEPDWFSKAQEYYEKALDASRTHGVVL